MERGHTHDDEIPGGQSRADTAGIAAPLDPIEIELVRYSFHSVCDEMVESLVRSSHSPNIKERRDCSCCLYTENGEIAVQAEHIPVHLGVMANALSAIIEAYPANDMAPGDVFLLNDPYYGANHLPDFIVVGPLYVDGQLIGFAASMAHHTDVGGSTPRSMPATATEIFHEGLRIPPVRLVSGGRLDLGLARLIAANSRLPEERAADLDAQVATIRVAQNRIDEMARKYSAAQIRFAAFEIVRLSDVATRTAIAALPDARWEAEVSADFGEIAIPIKVSICKDNDLLVVDFDGSGAQTTSPFNSSMANTLACVYMAVRITIAEGIPANAGMYRALRIKVPAGSILNPQFPSAVSAATQVSYHTFEALINALSSLVPDRVLAANGGGGVFSFGGSLPGSGKLFAYGEALGGGAGASAFADGESGMIPPIANLHDTPVEVLETNIPVRIERYELVDDSAGQGRHRGGFGLRRSFRMLTSVMCSFQVSMPRRGPSGLEGGTAGAPTRITVMSPDGQVVLVDKFTELVAPAGALVEIETAGGGGFGLAAERNPQSRDMDRRRGYGLPREQGAPTSPAARKIA